MFHPNSNTKAVKRYDLVMKTIPEWMNLLLILPLQCLPKQKHEASVMHTWVSSLVQSSTHQQDEALVVPLRPKWCIGMKSLRNWVSLSNLYIDTIFAPCKLIFYWISISKNANRCLNEKFTISCLIVLKIGTFAHWKTYSLSWKGLVGHILFCPISYLILVPGFCPLA